MEEKMKYVKTAFIALIIAAFLLACAGCRRVSAGEGLTPVSEDRADEMVEDLDRGLVNANTRFAFNIFNQLIAEDEGMNIFISPLSILLALAMVYNGAAGETSLAMADAMEFEGMDMEELNQGFSSLMISLLSADKSVELSIANSIWQRQDFDVKEDFLETNKKYYNSGVRKLDFSDPGAVDIINGWISDATRGKIEDMIDEIPPAAVMYLINAIYFKGDWTYPFEEEATYDEDFYLSDGSTASVPMMHMTEDFEYGAFEGFKIIRLPYGRQKLAMYILLPDEGGDLDSIIRDMDEERWKDHTERLSGGEVELSLPRYKMEYGVKLLNDTLGLLGMEIAFTPMADFSNIAPGIFISRVMHKAVIEVNEKGSEAAAATVVEMAESAMPVEEIREFKADRPFMFTISDDRTGSILFMGKLMEP
jgi:serine protease inhibitor